MRLAPRLVLRPSGEGSEGGPEPLHAGRILGARLKRWAKKLCKFNDVPSESGRRGREGLRTAGPQTCSAEIWRSAFL